MSGGGVAGQADTGVEGQVSAKTGEAHAIERNGDIASSGMSRAKGGAESELDASGDVRAKTGEAQRAQADAEHASDVAGDPQGAAKAEGAVRVEQKTGDAQRSVGEVRSTAENPEAAAQGRADAKIAEQKRDATAKVTGDVRVSTDGDASVTTSTDKPGDKK
jgi:hypothetical protein